MKTKSKKEVVEILRESRKPATFKGFQISEVERVGGQQMSIGSTGELECTEWARSQMLRRLKIPKSFYDGLDAGLQERVVKNQRAAIKDNARYKVRIVDDKITAILPASYAEAPVENLVNQLPDWNYVLFSNSPEDKVLYFRAFADDLKFKDDICAGFDMAFSEVGGYNMVLESLLFKLSCTNGMIRSRRAGTSFFKMAPEAINGPELLAVFKSLSDRLVEDKPNVVKKLEDAEKAKIQYPMEMVNSWFDQKVPGIVVKKMAARLSQEKDLDQMTNQRMSWLVSNVATEIENYQTRLHFERMAGRILKIGLPERA